MLLLLAKLLRRLFGCPLNYELLRLIDLDQ